jgi:cell division protease FtsH
MNRRQSPERQPPNANQQRDEEQQSLGPKLPGGGLGSMIIWFLILVTVGFWAWSQFNGGLTNRTDISYSTFREQVRDDNVKSVTISGQTITGELKTTAKKEIADGETVEYTDFTTTAPSTSSDEQFIQLLEDHEVQISVEPQSQFSWLALIVNFLPFLLLIGLGYVLLTRMRSQGQSIFGMGQSRARLYDRRKERITFEDVAGVQGAKTELREIIEFLRDPSRFQRLGGEMPRGVLLVGPPGTGKTLLARAVAGEAGVPFFSISGSDFMEMFVGVGASRVRDMFEEAKKASPSIIFIDELDSIGRRRGAGLGGGHDEREQTLNQLLSEMDGFEPNEGVIVMAATNRPDILDSALLRPGRFDRQITVDLPSMQDRLEILKIHARNKPLSDDVDLERVARGTPGFSGADLENLLNEAALLAARKDKDVIESEDIEEARDKVLMGLKRENLMLMDEELEILAYHEAGHAVVAALLPHSDPLHKVTIVPRGRAMGVTQQLPEHERYIYPREYMLDRLAVMMGGRAAEDLVFDTATSGAADDLKQATRLARKMVLDWGMSERLGNMALGDDRDQVFLGEDLTQRRIYSDLTAREVDEEIKSILGDAYHRATNTLQENRDGLDAVAHALLEQEAMPGEQVLELLGVDREIAMPSLLDDGRASEPVREA